MAKGNWLDFLSPENREAYERQKRDASLGERDWWPEFEAVMLDMMAADLQAVVLAAEQGDKEKVFTAAVCLMDKGRLVTEADRRQYTFRKAVEAWKKQMAARMRHEKARTSGNYHAARLGGSM